MTLNESISSVNKHFAKNSKNPATFFHIDTIGDMKRQTDCICDNIIDSIFGPEYANIADIGTLRPTVKALLHFIH